MVQRWEYELSREVSGHATGKHTSPGDRDCDADHALKHVQTQDASFPAGPAPSIGMLVSESIAGWSNNIYHKQPVKTRV